jgi:hypothetical protein
MKSEDDDGKIVDFVEAREKLDAAFETAQEKVRQDAARFKQAYQDCLARGIVVELSDEQRELMTLLDSLESLPISRQRRMVASYLALVAQRRVESVKRKRTGASSIPAASPPAATNKTGQDPAAGGSRHAATCHRRAGRPRAGSDQRSSVAKQHGQTTG